jgi:hypothetical protein
MGAGAATTGHRSRALRVYQSPGAAAEIAASSSQAAAPAKLRQ